MAHITIDCTTEIGRIKPMHAVNNGPIYARSDQTRGNFALYKAAGIPFARNHDAAFCASYGGEHSVDISAVFPNFDADPTDPASYDFAMTDEYLRTTLAAGTKIFYRLGSKIEHGIKKYGTLPPKDFNKWAVVCEHIIRHFNEGFADGHHWDIEYWEIWNEPDLDPDDSTNKRCWGGTAKEFYELFKITARHLKACFPNLKIGGPALAHNTGAWLDGFLDALTADETPVPLDFFSWHIYSTDPWKVMDKATIVREKLDRAGYTETESILNEWNYVENWNTKFIHSIEQIIGIRGAAFTTACMCEGQNGNIDMMMYYDARPSAFNGLFEYYTFRPLKGYYPFVMFNELYILGTQVKAESDDRDIHVVSAKNGETSATMICYYSPDENAAEKNVTIDANGTYSLYTLDDANDYTKTAEITCPATITMKPDTVVMIKGKREK